MMICSTYRKFAALAASLAAGTVLFASGGGRAAPQFGGVNVKPLEVIIYVGATRDHRQGGSTDTSSAQGGVTVDGKEGKVTTSRGCRSYGPYGRPGCRPTRAWDYDWRNPRNTVRDHRSK